MNIRNRLNDLVDVQNHMLQDFLKIVQKENYGKDEWERKISSFVEQQEKNKYYDKVSEAKKIIFLEGIENFSIDKMDVSFISSFIIYGDLNIRNKNKLKLYLDEINSDRNIAAHLNSNETDNELYGIAIDSIKSLKDFVDAIWDNKRYIGQKWIDYIKRYKREVQDIREKIENDYDEIRKKEYVKQEMLRDIAIIKKSNNPRNELAEVLKRRGYEHPDNLNKLIDFCKLAFNCGIPYWADFLGYHYFYGLGTERDYELASKYYEVAIRENPKDPEAYLNLASIYHNELVNGHNKEDADKILNLLRKTGFEKRHEISTYLTNEGYEFYIQRKKENT